jgi:hypothetical protein
MVTKDHVLILNGARSTVVFLAGLFCVLVSLSCGFEPVRKIEKANVTPAPGDAGQGFSLAGPLDKRSFAGSLLVWRPETSREDVAAILGATFDYNKAYTRSRQSIAALYQSDLYELDARRRDVQAKLAESGTGGGDEAKIERDRRLAAGNVWFEETLERLTKEHPEDFAPDAARALFARYCDAKLWELASRPLVADGQFSLRPIATPICESYYKQRSYFDAVDCFDSDGAGDSAGRNYFGCIWRSLRKTTFVTEGPLNDAIHGPVLEALAGSLEFRKLVSGKDGTQTLCGVDASSIRKFLALRVIQTETCTIPGSNVVLELSVPTESRAASRLERMSPATVVTFMDDQETRVGQDNLLALYPKALLLAASQGPRSGRELTPLERASDDFAIKLAALGKRSAKCGDQAAAFSASDVLMNLPFAVSGVGAFRPTREAESLDSARCVGLPDPKLFPEILSVQGASEEARAALEADLKELNSKRDVVVSRYCDMNNGLAESDSRRSEIEARPRQSGIVEQRAILATRDLRLELAPGVVSQGDSSDPVRARLRFGPDASPVEGCFDGYASGVPVVCPGSSSNGTGSGDQVLGAEVRFSPESGALVFRLELTDAVLTSIGLSNAIGFLKDSVMVIEMYGNSFEGLVPYVSGAVRFERGDQVVGRGVASYLIEANEAYRESNDLVRQCPRLGF